MRLVYDLRYAGDHFPGIGAHAHALATALLEAPGIERIRFLWHPGTANTRFDLRALRAHPRAAWQETAVPPLALSTAPGTGDLLRREPADAYLSPFWLAPQRAGMPCALTLHDVIPLALPATTAWPRRLAYAWAIRRAASAAAVLTSSRFSRDEILRLTPIRAERLHVVALGVAAPGTGARRPAAAPDGPFALCVGADRPHKGHATLRTAWRTFDGQPPLELVFAGSTGGSEASGVRALGAVAPDELEWLYRNAAMTLFPSVYEGFGLPLLESAARGTPVIAADIPALHETGDGVARFVEATDAPAWARAVRELAADAAVRERMRAAGLARASEFGYARCAAAACGVLEQVTAASVS